MILFSNMHTIEINKKLKNNIFNICKKYILNISYRINFNAIRYQYY